MSLRIVYGQVIHNRVEIQRNKFFPNAEQIKKLLALGRIIINFCLMHE